MKNASRLLLVPLALVACNRTPEPDPATKPVAPSATTAAAASASAPVTGKQLAWDAPSGWSRVDNPSPMRKATYRLPKQEGDVEQPELTVTVAGGSVDANIDRWVSQFDDAAKSTLKKETKKLASYDVTIVELRGAFTGMAMPGAPNPAGPKPGWAMLAAIVPVADDARWFFKMTGPEKSVAAARRDFDALLVSLRPQ